MTREATQPTVGRIVHYVSYGTPGGEFPSTCRAAIVTEAPLSPASQLVGLAVLNPTGIFFNNAGQDEKLGDGGYAMTPGTWHWPCTRTPE